MNYQKSKINFFGDSWFWNWYGPALYDYILTSKIMKTDSFYSNSRAQRISCLKFYCDELGFNTKIYNLPANNFYQTVDSIVKIKPDKDTLVNIVFFSNLIRVNNFKDFPIHSCTETLHKIKQDTIILLQQLIKWAEENKTYLFLVGGHSQLSLDLFKEAGYSKYVFLLSECIIATIASILHKKDIKPFGIFRLACFTGYLDKTWDKLLIDMIYHQTTSLNKSTDTKLLFFPDTGHLNSLSSMVLLDMIFNKLEELQLVK